MTIRTSDILGAAMASTLTVCGYLDALRAALKFSFAGGHGPLADVRPAESYRASCLPFITIDFSAVRLIEANPRRVRSAHLSQSSTT